MITRADLIDVLFVIAPHSLLLDIAGPAEAFRLANLHRERRGLPPRFRLRFAGPVGDAADVGRAGAGRPRALAGAARLADLGRGRRPADRARDPGHAGDRGHRAMAERTAARRAPRRRHAAPPGHDLLGHPARRAGGAARHAPLHDAPRAAAMCFARWRRRRRSIDNRVFVVDGPLASSAGITAGIDVALHLIAEECGEALAASVAEDMVVYLRRSPRDTELSPFHMHRRHLHPAVHRVQDAIVTEPERDWDMASLAAVGHAAERHLLRLFIDHAGVSPLHYLRLIRLERARQSLEYGATVTRAAEVAGFGSDLQLRRAWSRQWGGSPRGPL